MTRRDILVFSMVLGAIFMLGVGLGIALQWALKDATATLAVGMMCCLGSGFLLSKAGQAHDH